MNVELGVQKIELFEKDSAIVGKGKVALKAFKQ